MMHAYSVMILNQKCWQSLGAQHGKGVDGLFELVSYQMTFEGFESGSKSVVYLFCIITYNYINHIIITCLSSVIYIYIYKFKHSCKVIHALWTGKACRSLVTF